ncbi:hypothetical protein [Streptomyces sp. ODS28]|uniref:hypothetical protein n=1 Tax=Streptomyces sp. ODS28 TaxID=3136688 RepID=UPI0031F02C92
MSTDEKKAIPADEDLTTEDRHQTGVPVLEGSQEPAEPVGDDDLTTKDRHQTIVPAQASSPENGVGAGAAAGKKKSAKGSESTPPGGDDRHQTGEPVG